jgi:hypothetical protein
VDLAPQAPSRGESAVKQVAVHAALALLGLIAAYQTWTREEVVERPAGEVTILECAQEQLTAITLRTPTHLIEVAPSARGAERDYWVTTQPAPKADKSDAAKDAPPAAIAAPDAGATPAATPDAIKPEEAAKPNPVVEKLRKPRRFLANAKFDEYVAQLAPLRAARGLGVVPKEKFAEFGFDKVGTFVDIRCGAQKLTLEVGERTYGTGKRYVREQKSGQVYLFEGAFVQDLQSAEYKFMQKELHGFTLADVDEAQVVAAGAVRKLVHRNRQIKEQARWVDAAQPDQRNELFGNWFDRVDRLKVREYLGDGAEPGSDLENAGAVSEVVRIEYAAEGKPKGTLTLVRVNAAGEPRYYAKTETTGHWVAVFDSVAKQVEGDVPMLMGKEEPPPPSGAAPQAPAPGSAPAAAPGHGAPAVPGHGPSTAPSAPPPPTALPPGHPTLPPGH